MKSFVAQHVRSNAYRMLGLHAGAAQEQIDQAARRMRIWSDPSETPPTAWDMPWLGAIQRDKNGIEQAVARLNDPISRIHERLYWFAATQPDLSKLDAHLVADTARSLEGSTDPVVRHDGMLLQAATQVGQPIMEARQLVFWEHLLRRATAVARDDDYLAWFQEVESDGQFEKRASIEETAAALDSLPAAMAEDLAQAALLALDNGDAPLAIKIAGLLHKLETNGTCLGDITAPILNRMEDQYTAACNSIIQSVERDIHFQWDRAGLHKSHNERVCRDLAQRYQQIVAPAYRALTTIFMDAGDQQRVERIGLLAVKSLKALSTGAYWCQDFITAVDYLDQAILVATGTTMAQELRADRERIRLSAERQGKGWRVDVPAKGVAAGETFMQRGKNYTSSGTTGSRGIGRGVWILIVVGGMILRGVFSLSSNSSSSSTPYYSTPTYTYPQRVPINPDAQRFIDENNRQKSDGSAILSKEPFNTPPLHSQNNPWLPGSPAPAGSQPPSFDYRPSGGGAAPSPGRH